MGDEDDKKENTDSLGHNAQFSNNHVKITPNKVNNSTFFSFFFFVNVFFATTIHENRYTGQHVQSTQRTETAPEEQ